MRQAAFEDWIGREDKAVTDLVTPRLVAGFEATFGSALVARSDETLAPLGLHWCLCPPAAPTESLGIDGHAATGEFLPPLDLPRRMWAGSEIRIHDSLRLGDEVERSTTIENIVFKEGRTGRLAFVTLLMRYATARGCALDERQTLVYREQSRGTPDLAPQKHAVPTEAAAFPVSNPLLFRYSALTFNAHRIHYDLAYAREVEGYADLVVHGPLQATLLLNHAAKYGEVKVFNIRALAPAVGAQVLRMSGDGEGGFSLYDANGVKTMSGQVTP